MDLRELRMGNFVNNDFIVSEILADCLTVQNTNSNTITQLLYDDIEPTPLTKEWLVKFGFGKSIARNWYSNDQYAIEMCKNFIQFDVGYTTITLDCMFVHQLQNIYFTLTGEELTIKK